MYFYLDRWQHHFDNTACWLRDACEVRMQDTSACYMHGCSVVALTMPCCPMFWRLASCARKTNGFNSVHSESWARIWQFPLKSYSFRVNFRVLGLGLGFRCTRITMRRTQEPFSRSHPPVATLCRLVSTIEFQNLRHFPQRAHGPQQKCSWPCSYIPVHNTICTRPCWFEPVTPR